MVDRGNGKQQCFGVMKLLVSFRPLLLDNISQAAALKADRETRRRANTEAIYTMFEITFAGSWPLYARPVIEDIAVGDLAILSEMGGVRFLVFIHVTFELHVDGLRRFFAGVCVCHTLEHESHVGAGLGQLVSNRTCCLVASGLSFTTALTMCNSMFRFGTT